MSQQGEPAANSEPLAESDSSPAQRIPVISLASALMGGLLLLLLGYFLLLSQQFAFDTAPDMDLMSAHDALLVNSGLAPLHTDHPRFGMQLLSSWSVGIARGLKLISVANLPELGQSPSPILPMAELIMFLRAGEAVIVWLLLVLTIRLLWRLFPRQRLLHFFALPLLGFETGLLHCAMILRTEVFSILILLIGLNGFEALLSLSARRSRFWPEALAWLLAGFSLGLAMLTKLQAILAAPFFFACGGYIYTRYAAGLSKVPARLRQLMPPIFGLSLLLWLGLAWLAHQTPTLPGCSALLYSPAADELNLKTLLAHMKLQLVWLALLASFGLVPALAWARRRAWPRLHQRSSLYGLLGCGMLWSFAAPMLTYAGQAQGLAHSWSYLLQLTQSVIWTDTSATTSSTAGALAATLQFTWASDRNYPLLAGAGLMFLLLMLMQSQPKQRRQEICLGLLLAGDLLLLAGARPLLRDMIWFDFLGTLGLLLLLNQSWDKLASRRFLRGLLILCLGLPALFRTAQLPQTLDQIYLNYAPYRSGQFVLLANAPCALPEMPYPRLMAAAYGAKLTPPDNSDRDRLRLAVDQARLIGPLRQLADWPFLGRQLPVRALGLASPGLPAWKHDTSWARFSRVENALNGSLLIDPLQLEANARPWSWIGVNEHAPLAERWIKTTGRQELALFPNGDTQLLICVSQPDYDRQFFYQLQGPPMLEISLGASRIPYYVMQIRPAKNVDIHWELAGYSTLSLDWLRSLEHPPFFLLHHGQGWGPAWPDWETVKSTAK